MSTLNKARVSYVVNYVINFAGSFEREYMDLDASVTLLQAVIV